MSSIHLDTSIIIDFLRAKKKEQTSYIHVLKKHERTSLSVIVEAELYAGRSVWEHPDAQRAIAKLISGHIVIPCTSAIAQHAGEIRAKNDLNLLDSLIAATALEADAQLATLNARDFKKVPYLKVYPF